MSNLYCWLVDYYIIRYLIGSLKNIFIILSLITVSYIVAFQIEPIRVLMKKVLINQLSRLDELMKWILNTVRVFLFIVFFYHGYDSSSKTWITKCKDTYRIVIPDFDFWWRDQNWNSLNWVSRVRFWTVLIFFWYFGAIVSSLNFNEIKWRYDAKRVRRVDWIGNVGRRGYHICLT